MPINTDPLSSLMTYGQKKPPNRAQAFADPWPVLRIDVGKISDVQPTQKKGK